MILQNLNQDLNIDSPKNKENKGKNSKKEKITKNLLSTTIYVSKIEKFKNRNTKKILSIKK